MAGCTVWFVWALVRVISSVRLNLTLNEDGFVFNGREVAWDQVKSVEINDFAMLDRVFIRLWDRDWVHYTIPGSIGQAPEVHEAIKDRAVRAGAEITTVPSLARQAAGATLWGVFFSTQPYDGALFPLAIIWPPLLIWAELRRTRRFGFMPGALVRGVVIIAVLAAAAVAPLKYTTERIPVLGPTQATLKEVDSLHAETTGRSRPRLFAALDDSLVATTVVRLPDRPLGRADFLAYIGEQLGCEPRVLYEGGYTSVAFGAHPMFVGWRDTSGLDVCLESG